MSLKLHPTDVLIIGASASGLMCAIEAGKRGRNVTVLDHANKAGKKILMSGGGRCNFTNYTISAENYLSHNPHFCKSALNRYTQWDFIGMVSDHNIPYHERDHGQLFCNDSAKDILNMLLRECAKVGVQIRLNTHIDQIRKNDKNEFVIDAHQETFSAKKTSTKSNAARTADQSTDQFKTSSLVIACGGLSIPTMGATPFGYQIADQFGHHVWPVSAGLVPFTLQPEDKEKFSPLSGIAINSRVHNQPTNTNEKNQHPISFRENILFTHRGLSGPSILQISNYWRPGEVIEIDLIPDENIQNFLIEKRRAGNNTKLKNVLADKLPSRLLISLLGDTLLDQTIQNTANAQIDFIHKQCHQWTIKPNGTEGYRTAEVTLGGVDCDQLSSKTMESNLVAGLYFIGEVVDVTGWLGGYNFQWAWASGWSAGQVV